MPHRATPRGRVAVLGEVRARFRTCFSNGPLRAGGGGGARSGRAGRGPPARARREPPPLGAAAAVSLSLSALAGRGGRAARAARERACRARPRPRPLLERFCVRTRARAPLLSCPPTASLASIRSPLLRPPPTARRTARRRPMPHPNPNLFLRPHVPNLHAASSSPLDPFFGSPLDTSAPCWACRLCQAPSHPLPRPTLCNGAASTRGSPGSFLPLPPPPWGARAPRGIMGGRAPRPGPAARRALEAAAPWAG
jgi:hypothetical protein